jgi:hypothetical protein
MSQSTALASAASAKSEVEISTIRAISVRLITFLVLAYFFSYLDRVNLGFAALTMNAQMKFSPLIFACGAGIFFIGYFLFEVPSNLALEKFGASRVDRPHHGDLGITSALMATVSCEWSFYGLRFLLGVAETSFSRHHPLSHLLVSGRVSRPLSRGVRDRRARLDHDRRAGLGPFARARRRDGVEGLAVAVHH